MRRVKSFRSSDMGPLRAEMKRTLVKAFREMDPQFAVKVDNIEWMDDHCWARVRIGLADPSLIGRGAGDYTVTRIEMGGPKRGWRSKPYVLRKKDGAEFRAGAQFVEDAFGHKEKRR
jgi:hypothetical protein